MLVFNCQVYNMGKQYIQKNFDLQNWKSELTSPNSWGFDQVCDTSYIACLYHTEHLVEEGWMWDSNEILLFWADV
jgi:hypothetical protein